MTAWLYPPKTGTRGGIRTVINLFLRQAPLRLGYARILLVQMLRLELRTFCFEDRRSRSIELHPRKISGRQDLNLRTLDSKSSPFSHLWNTLVCSTSGKGVEPLFPGSEPGVLPVRRSRKNSCCQWSAESGQRADLNSDRRPLSSDHCFCGYSVVKNQKRSGYDWFLHETGVTAP